MRRAEGRAKGSVRAASRETGSHHSFFFRRPGGHFESRSSWRPWIAEDERTAPLGVLRPGRPRSRDLVSKDFRDLDALSREYIV